MSRDSAPGSGTNADNGGWYIATNVVNGACGSASYIDGSNTASQVDG